MADVKISALNALGTAPAAGDLLPVVDVSGAETKKLRIDELFTNPNVTGTVTADGLISIAGDQQNYLGIAADNGTYLGYIGTLPSSSVSAHVGWCPSTVTGGVNGDLIFAPRTSVAAGMYFYTGSTTPSKRLYISGIGDLSLFEDTGTTAKFFWDASAEYLGIGTATPTNTLNVLAPDNNGIQIESAAGEKGYLFFGDNGSNTAGRVGYDHATDHLDFWTDGTERMRIDSSGNVGIGTASPTAGRLQVNGEKGSQGIHFLAEDTGTGNTGGFWCGNSGTTFEADPANAIASSFMGFNVDGSEAARIDQNGNLLIGTTSVDVSTSTGSVTGTVINSDGLFEAARTGSSAATVAIFNKLDFDGVISEFRKDGTTVGSIGTGGGSLTVNSSGSTLVLSATDVAVQLSSTEFRPFTADDATVNLGGPSQRFKDLYLSGGVYLGGTAGPTGDPNNYLDDYEEGSFTPVIAGTTTAGTATYTNQIGKYTKIGNMVYANIYLNWSGHTGTGDMTISGLPFNAFTQAGISIGNVVGITKPANHVIGGNTNFNSNVIRLYSADASSTAYTGSNLAMDAIGLLNVTLVYRID